MTLETFFEKFDRFADTPDAVAKMRELVLDLAVTGKLSKGTEAWAEAPLGEVSRLRRGYDLPTQDRKQGFVPIFAANGPVGVHDVHMVKGPGVVTGRSGSIGKVHLVNEDFWPLNTALYVEDFFGNYPRFICLLLRSLRLEHFSTATAVPTLNRNVVHKAIVKVPPLAEQKRIVAKVDELMAFCDRLDAQQQERETRHAALARASLARFADAPTPANLNFLFHNSYTIEPADLRKSILTLAVQGKLVAQDANDEPAEYFLDRTKARHALPATGSKSRKTNGTVEIAEDEIPFAIPESWAWCRLEAIADKVTDGEHLSPVKTTSGMPLLTATHVTNKGVTLNNPQYVSLADGRKCRLRCDPSRGDILICSRGTIGRCAVVETDEIFCLMGSVILVRFPAETTPRYFNYFLSTELAQAEMRGMSGATAVQALYLKDIRKSLVPIPPLAEQRRIVGKVDQLMALVDKLEAQLAASRGTAAKLIDAVVAELLSME